MSPTTENLEALMRILKVHAARVCWLILRTVDHHLTQEMVDDAILDLPKFEEKSAFSTWIHARFRFAVIDELRYRKKNLNHQLGYVLDGDKSSESLDKYEFFANDTPQRVEAENLRDRLLESLNLQEQHVMRLHLLGWKKKEIAKDLQVTPQRISQILIQTKRKLWDQYNK